MATDLAAFFDRWKSDRARINREVPYLGRDFATMYKSIMKDGALYGAARHGSGFLGYKRSFGHHGSPLAVSRECA